MSQDALNQHAEKIIRWEKKYIYPSATEYYYEEKDKPQEKNLLKWDATKWKYKIELYTRTIFKEDSSTIIGEENHLIWSDKNKRVVKIEPLTQKEGTSFFVDSIFGYYVCSPRKF